MEELKNIPLPKEIEEMTEEEFNAYCEAKELQEKKSLDEQSEEEQEEEIIEQEEIQQPTFYRIEPNENGEYIKDNKRYDLQSCHRTESLETYETGEFETVTDEEGNEIQIPITATRVVVNKGWLEFESEEQAIEYFGLTKVEDNIQNEVEE